MRPVADFQSASGSVTGDVRLCKRPPHPEHPPQNAKIFEAEVIEFEGFLPVISIILCVAACEGSLPKK